MLSPSTYAPNTNRTSAITDPIIRGEFGEFHFEHDAVIYCLGLDGELDSVNFIITIDGRPDWIEEVYALHWNDQWGYRSFEGKSATESVFVCDDIQPDPSVDGPPVGRFFDSHYQGFIVMGDFVAPGLTWKEYWELIHSKSAPATSVGDSGVMTAAVALLVTHSETSHSKGSLCTHAEAEELAAHVLLLANSIGEKSH